MEPLFRLCSTPTTPTAVTLRLSGDQDHDTVVPIREAIDDVLADGARLVCVDLEDVTFMGAALLGVLVAARRRCHRSGALLTVRCEDPRLRRLFAVTGLDGAWLVPAPAGIPQQRRPAS
jgi:anti-sigma B factor antagonist